jgi:hypothetical protein
MQSIGVAAIVIWLGFTVFAKVDTYFHNQAIDACAKFAIVTWTDKSNNDVVISEPHAPGFDSCMKKKGY